MSAEVVALVPVHLGQYVAERLIVELDTEDTHKDRFATDRLRDRKALAHGITSIRVTPDHLTDELAKDLRTVMLRQCA